MTRHLRAGAMALAAFATMASAPAQAACWGENAVAAAKVRDLETMLMVSALRCRLTGADFLPKYNRFVEHSRTALVAVNETLRAHFAIEAGQRQALNAYDRFVTSIANRYGAGRADLDCRDMESILDAAAAEGQSFNTLATLAERARVEPVLTSAACRVRVAAVR